MKFARVLAISCLLISTMARAENLPPKIQAVLYKKIFAYDRTLPDDFKVYILSKNDPAQGLVKAFQDVGLTAVVVKFETIKEVPQGVVLYVYPDSNSKEVADHCSKNKILTISGQASLAESGEVAIGVGLTAEGKPEIVVHFGRVKAESHDLAADFLRLARVIK